MFKRILSISKGISGALVALLALLYPFAVHSCHMERTYPELERTYSELGVRTKSWTE